MLLMAGNGAKTQEPVRPPSLTPLLQRNFQVKTPTGLFPHNPKLADKFNMDRIISTFHSVTMAPTCSFFK